MFVEIKSKPVLHVHNGLQCGQDRRDNARIATLQIARLDRREGLI